MANAKYLKERFHTAYKEADEAKVVKVGTKYGSTYTIPMLHALKDMAEADVWPDYHFGDDDCNAWSLFHDYEKVDMKKEMRRLQEQLELKEGELQVAEEGIRLLKRKSERLSTILRSIMSIIPICGVYLTDNGEIADSETEEILSE